MSEMVTTLSSDGTKLSAQIGILNAINTLYVEFQHIRYFRWNDKLNVILYWRASQRYKKLAIKTNFR